MSLCDRFYYYTQVIRLTVPTSFPQLNVFLKRKVIPEFKVLQYICTRQKKIYYFYFYQELINVIISRKIVF